MELWPAIDLRHGRCVRLKQGDYDRETVFGEDPAAMARHWVEAGARRLHLVDLDAARGEPSDENRAAILAIVEAAGVPCQLGGGVRDDGSIRSLLNLGLERLIVGSAALKRPDWFANACDANPGKLAAGIDARNGMVATDGWLETSSTPATELARDLRRRTSEISAIIYTDIARDGMMSGPNVEALREMEAATDIPVIASGGVTTIDDVRMLAESGTYAAIIGRALYEGTIDLKEATQIAEPAA
ncbi:1-(5-phosphoribosyl)-5-[(5-phosphoribosylamino)methylideneamino]imidazole-4-carboxamide isomerase [Candidatus Laterigemmans baculatus]|uniref:1-(5-phosphoribosyl)-5-[(5- phosphoribosylamino)methylideneamino]imidazole-4- carboxamide isomerase n=1 Tax=Candidatus Laterigemmans baculatus TaxID=2770505 RepID=UPI0013DCBA6A|nr:1-(5-phosphoribosyl)-5-[(5-phosphoribosylamino)methylideneamino]imidazole-4-carboxamide isomerase [Candidatus Laterigemmans baculatus]